MRARECSRYDLTWVPYSRRTGGLPRFPTTRSIETRRIPTGRPRHPKDLNVYQLSILCPGTTGAARRDLPIRCTFCRGAASHYIRRLLFAVPHMRRLPFAVPRLYIPAKESSEMSPSGRAVEDQPILSTLPKGLIKLARMQADMVSLLHDFLEVIGARVNAGQSGGLAVTHTDHITPAMLSMRVHPPKDA
jgi:hypothetical protein